jgi:endonuclease G
LTYERGHQVPANHLDHSKLAIRQSNFMTNSLPQTATLNRGAWLRTEVIVKCYRDQTELLVLGGAIWGKTKAAKKNDYFVGSHNIRTPESFWKVVIAGDGSTIAWLIPNDQNATTAKLDRFLIKPVQLELKAKLKLPEVPKAWRIKKPKRSWVLPVGCDLG